MSDTSHPQSGGEHFQIPPLSLPTHEALAESALSNGRTIHEEAEQILKAHLASFGDKDE
jgi:hypothetical protein